MSDTNEQERGIRDMLQFRNDLQAQIIAAAETQLKPQLDWLAARSIGPETRTQIVKAWLDGNHSIYLALEGIDFQNSSGRDWNQDVLYTESIWSQLRRSTKRLGVEWDWNR